MNGKILGIKLNRFALVIKLEALAIRLLGSKEMSWAAPGNAVAAGLGFMVDDPTAVASGLGIMDPMEVAAGFG